MPAQTPSTPLAVADVRLEHLRETLGIGYPRPRLSWTVQTAAQNWRQAAYEIESSDPSTPAACQAVKVESDQSLLVPWPFEPLRSRQKAQVRVRVWGADGQFSDWSQPLALEAGLLHLSDWSARFVGPDWDEDTTRQQPAPFLRREFQVRPGLQSARLYVTALGVYEAQVNGVQAGDLVLAPGWTSYHHRLRYQAFDVTPLLHEGPNALGAILADGWFRGRIGFGAGKRNSWGDRLALLAQLELHYADGSTQQVLSDGSWRAGRGPILSSGIYEGETYDARLELPGWSSPGFDDSAWSGVRPVEYNLAALIAPPGPPVRRMESVQPVKVFESPTGKILLDFGQNLVGRLRLHVKGGQAGQVITLRHAEVLEGGELCTRPLRHAEATDYYTLAGRPEETWEARFTFHGFRYAQVDGWPGRPAPEDIQAVVLHSDMQRTGWFECSNALVNRLHENTRWSMRGNFLDLPTDCPQRDERLGWTGDIQVFSPTASFLYDSSGFLQSWLADLAAEQKELDGVVPPVIPNTLGTGFGAGAAAWADAAVVVPWVLYQYFGDPAILSAQFESMRSWVDHLVRVSGEKRLWDHGFQFGDWLDPTAPPDNPAAARADRYLVATAYFARSARMVSQAAAVLGRKEEQEYYGRLADEVRDAFAREYVTPAGRVMSDAETAYAVALGFDLLTSPDQAHRAAARLLEMVQAGGYHIRTGFVGTPLMCDVLTSTGNVRAAYGLLLQTECPSWLYPVTMGGTTIWERWDSMLPDGSVNPGEMTSFNHYALGAVADWMERVVGGLAPAAPGYRRIAVKPLPGGGLTSASASHLTPYGLASSAWKLEHGKMTLDVTIPPNTSALVALPGSGRVPFEVGSGVYHWSYPYTDPFARGPLTVDDTVGEIMSYPEAWKALASALQRAANTPFILPMLMNEPGVPLRQLLSRGPAAALLPVAAEALAQAKVG